MNIEGNSRIINFLSTFTILQANKLSTYSILDLYRLANDERKRRITHYVRNTLKPM